MRTITLEAFHAELFAQNVEREHWAFKCPMCGTVQSAADLIAVGAGATFEDVEKYLGFSCVGRWKGLHFTKQSRGAGQGCDWTLGGFLQFHKLEVIFRNERVPRFEVASPEEARAHLAAKAAP